MLDKELEQAIVNFIAKGADYVGHGKIMFSVTVHSKNIIGMKEMGFERTEDFTKLLKKK